MAKNRILSQSIGRAVTRYLCTAAANGGKGKRLYRRLSELGGDAQEGRVAETMDAWSQEGGPVHQIDLVGIAKELRRYKCHSNALQLIDWMEKKGVELTSSSHAVRLDLISKVKGIDMAEKYFSSLPEPTKNQKTYGALLNNYCHEKMVDKAVALFEKLKQLNWASSSLNYNIMMALHMKSGQPEKVIGYFQEMKAANISPDTFTFNILMNSYASVGDVDSVERVVKGMKENAPGALDWSTYCNLAAIYNSAGLFEKSESVIKEAERIMNPRDQTPYHFLISLYAGTGNLAEVRRVWNLLKASLKKTTNSSYLTMLIALQKLGDMDGLKQCFEDWESCHEIYDVRLVNIGIDVYLKMGMRDEAESLWRRALAVGVGSKFRTVEIFSNYYMERHESELAIKFLKLMAHAVRPDGWKPNKEMMNSFLKYFEEAKDVDGAEEACEALKKLDCLDSHCYESLLRTYLAAGRKNPHLHQRIADDGIEVSAETMELLEKVCFAD